MKILLFGGSGALGQALQMLDKNIEAPQSNMVDIVEGIDHWEPGHLGLPDVVIHAAAMTDNRMVEKNAAKAIDVNIIGTANIARWCILHNIRLVYISTDYVYPGDRGNYLESDPVQPFNLYAWTKLGGECATKGVPNHLIIRTSFAKDFKYKEAFVDKWTSKDYVDVIAPMILEAALSPLTGVLNLGTARKTLFEHAIEKRVKVVENHSGTGPEVLTMDISLDVKPVKIKDTNYHTPYDTSLNLQKWSDYKNEKPIAKPHTNCRCCGSTNLVKYLDLGLMPLANNLQFYAAAAKTVEKFPLQVLFCTDCGLSQLSVVIDPSKMFSYYTYRSAINKGYVQHCEEMARWYFHKYVLEGCLHLDIAGNDGTLIKKFREVDELVNPLHCPYKGINIDPATNLTAIAEADGIESITDFWGVEVAAKFSGTADLITATNVFAHVNDVHGFLAAAKIALAPKGLLVLEFPYLVNFVDQMEFDTVYFEHLSYMSLIPIIKMAAAHELEVVEVMKVAIHGGSLRVVLGHEDMYGASPDVGAVAEMEKVCGYNSIEKYSGWGEEVKYVIYDFGKQLLALKKAGNKIAAFAASAKGNTLLNCAGMTTDIIDFIADETPEKIGKYSPGTGIPIVNKNEILKQCPDFIVILSWNFAEDIITKVRQLGFTGQFIIPIPKFKIL